RNHIARHRAPCVVPIHIRFVIEIPCLGCDCRTDREHVQPTAWAVGGHQAKCGVVVPGSKQRFQQILRAIDTAWYSAVCCDARTEKSEDCVLSIRWHETKREWEKICVGRRVACPDAIHVTMR